VFGRVAAEKLGVPPAAVTILHGDSARYVPGFGAVASRSAMMVGGAIVRAVEAMVEKGRKIAALLLEAGETEIDYRDGAFHAGTRQISLFDVAERAKELVRQGVVAESMDPKGAVNAPASFPNGCHIADVEVDPHTGEVSLERYTAVDDCGNVLDPVIGEGQIHGGVAQGAGQALTEGVVFAANGQPLSGSFMDYAMPRAVLLPNISVDHRTTACRTNPLGVKGTGESGTMAAPPVIINAILDALPKDARAGLEMPATAERVWRALQPAG
jgi:carbon-monoxide dehydrogenase large subunit